MTGEWKEYLKKNVTEMRPYVEGESLAMISVKEDHEPQEGDMIARNPLDMTDKWLVSAEYFKENYVEKK